MSQKAEALNTLIVGELEYRALKMFEKGLQAFYKRELSLIRAIKFAKEIAPASKVLKKALDLSEDAEVMVHKVFLRTSFAPFNEEETLRATCELYQVLGQDLKPLHLKIRSGEKQEAVDNHFFFEKVSKDGLSYEAGWNPDWKN